LDNEKAVVVKFNNKLAEVQMIKTADCESCSINGVCHGGASDKTLIPIQTDLNLEVGDEVEIYISPSSRIFSSALIFLFPIISMIIFYLISRILFSLSENISIASSFLGLLISGLIIKYVDTRLSDKVKFQIARKV
ncbi:MAG: SoxR reducing system RseC family protein, partial [Candidatus Cloacimonadota bacterium]|nr:SoxR reducing system RseC family protein [Candidatus Cloacimonadota bacterium]